MSQNTDLYFSVESKKADGELAGFLISTQKELSEFYGFEARRPTLFFVKNRSDMDALWGKETQNWFVGGLKGGNIYIFSPDVFEKESSHKADEFFQTLKHELSHVYFTQITKGHLPRWLNEGLACHLSGKKIPDMKARSGDLLDVFLYFDKNDSGVYLVGQFWVEYLINKFGKEKILKLLSVLKEVQLDEKKFSSVFDSIYGFEFSRTQFTKFLSQ